MTEPMEPPESVDVLADLWEQGLVLSHQWLESIRASAPNTNIVAIMMAATYVLASLAKTSNMPPNAIHNLLYLTSELLESSDESDGQD